MVELLNCDCMQYMASVPDKYFELAVVDPPYAWGDSMFLNRPTPSNRKNKMKPKFDLKDWNKAVPSKEYWAELFRVSKNQIVWGGNYFQLPTSRGWIFWDKMFEKTHTFSHGELAWTSFDCILKMVRISSKAETRGGRDKIHINQKPKELYRFVYDNYAKAGDRILDTHLGSASSAIAAFQKGLDFVGCEADKDNFDAALARYERECDLGIFQMAAIADKGSVGKKNINTNNSLFGDLL